MTQLLAWRDRKRGAPTCAPDGLYLAAIDYPEVFGLRELDGGASLLSPFTQSY
jgi:tRNA pseudouridine38-40 synthase